MSFRHEVQASIDIDAPVPIVWGILVDLPQWSSWSTLLRWRAGEARPGEVLTLEMDMPEARFSFRPRVLRADGERLEWLGRTAGIPGLLDGHHSFELRPRPGGGCTVINREAWTGLLVPLVRRSAMMQAAGRGFETMNAELAARALRA